MKKKRKNNADFDYVIWTTCMLKSSNPPSYPCSTVLHIPSLTAPEFTASHPKYHVKLRLRCK